MALLNLIFGRGKLAPSVAVHPEDADLVGDEDTAWWRTLPLRKFKQFQKEVTASRVTLISYQMKYGAIPQEVAARNALRSLPRFYGTLEERAVGASDLASEDLPLPWALKKRVDDAILIGEVRKSDLAKSSSMNALIRRLIREGRI